MFVRFKKPARVKGWSSLSAYLVESRRIDGKPRQKVISYLATISEVCLADGGKRLRFWEDVEPVLRPLALTEPIRNRLLQQMRRACRSPPHRTGRKPGRWMRCFVACAV